MAAGKAASRYAGLARRVAEHVRTPVYRDGYALVLSAGISAALGFAYWIVAARSYTAEAVGLNSAVISAMMLVSGVAQLNLVGGLIRFVPTAGRSTGRLIVWSYAISVAAAVVVALVFLAGVRQFAPSLAFLSSGDGFVFWFVAVTMAFCVFNLQDAVLTGLRRATWVPVDNALFGVAKIGLLAVFVPLFPRFGIFASWTAGVVVSVIAINAVLVRRLIPAHTRAPVATLEHVNARGMARFVGADYVGGLSWIGAITLIPIAITQRIGAAENAYYSLAWVMTIPLYLVSASTASSLVVSLVREPLRLREYSHRVFVQTSRLVIPSAVVVAVAAPLLLRTFGPDYARHGATTLRLLALSSIPAMVTALYTGVWRAEKRLALLIWVRCVQNATVVLISLAVIGPYGIRGPAFVWLVVQTAVAAALVAVWPRVLFSGGAGVPWRLRGVRLVRNAAADTGLLSALQAVKGRPALLRRRGHAAAVLPRILAGLPQNGDGPSAVPWAAHEPLPGVTDKLVVPAGPPGGPAAVVVKLASSEQGAAGLERETEVLALLRADPRLAAWRSLLPQVLASGEVDGRPFRVEAILPGVAASRLLAAGAASGVCRLDALADSIEGLHRPTSRQVEVDATILGEWVDAPIAILDHHARSAGRPGRWRVSALERLRVELGAALAGRRVAVGWAHGDLVPGNFLVDPATGRVRGIVDWELAGDRRLQALDLVQLVLATRALRRRREYGEIVTQALAGAWTDEEWSLLERAALDREGPPLPVLLRLAWLAQTESLLTKTEGYAGNWLWQRSNLEAPLAALA